MVSIRTTDRKRENDWYSLFGKTVLPVKHARPRWQELPGGAVMAYDLDSSRLSSGAIDAFAHRLAKRHKVSFTEARHMVDNYPLRAEGCIPVLETADSFTWRERPFCIPALFSRHTLFVSTS
jgi:hypothetical protein